MRIRVHRMREYNVQVERFIVLRSTRQLYIAVLANPSQTIMYADCANLHCNL
jgi:hypothetical protein